MLKKLLTKMLARLGGEHLSAVIMRSISGVAVVKVIGAALGFIAHVVLARLLGVEEYGVYLLVWTWVVLLDQFTRLGFDKAIVRFVPQFNARGHFTKIRELISASTRATLLASSVVALSGIAFVVYLDDWLKPGNDKAFIIGLLVLPLVTLNEMRQCTLRGLKLVSLALVPQIVVRHSLLIVGALILLGVAQNVGSSTALVLTLVVFSVTLGISTLWVHRHLPTREGDNGTGDYGNENWIGKALPFLITSSAGFLQRRIDVVVLGAFAAASEVGEYGAAVRVLTLVSFGLGIVGMAVTPFFSELHDNDEYEKLQKLVGFITLAVSAFTITVGGAVVIAGPWVLSIFGPEFVDGYGVMVVLIIGSLFAALAGPCAHLLMMTGHEGFTSRAEGIAAGANLVLNFILVPLYGAYGAAVATVITVSVRNIAMAWVVKQRLGINSSILNPNILAHLRSQLAVLRSLRSDDTLR